MGLCVGVKGQKKVFHQFWNRCEYKKCKKMGKLMFVVEENFCESTVSNGCSRIDCGHRPVEPVCAMGDPSNEDYTYANKCYYKIAECVAKRNRGALITMRTGSCSTPNPHRFPSNFHRNWFIKMSRRNFQRRRSFNDVRNWNVNGSFKDRKNVRRRSFKDLRGFRVADLRSRR